jgi:hypothetical protein
MFRSTRISILGMPVVFHLGKEETVIRTKTFSETFKN